MYGSLDGSLESTAKVSIHSTGSVSGNVIYKKMVRFFCLDALLGCDKNGSAYHIVKMKVRSILL